MLRNILFALYRINIHAEPASITTFFTACPVFSRPTLSVNAICRMMTLVWPTARPGPEKPGPIGLKCGQAGPRFVGIGRDWRDRSLGSVSSVTYQTGQTLTRTCS